MLKMSNRYKNTDRYKNINKMVEERIAKKRELDRRLEQTTKFVPVRYGDFYIYNFDTGEPIRIDNDMVTRKNRGELHRLLVDNLEAKAKGLDNIFTRNGIKGDHFAIDRFVTQVEEGQHTHYREVKTIY